MRSATPATSEVVAYLVDQAMARRGLAHRELARTFELGREQLDAVLAEVAELCRTMELPPLPLIVYDDYTGSPVEHIYVCWGLTEADAGARALWRKQAKARVFTYDWRLVAWPIEA